MNITVIIELVKAGAAGSPSLLWPRIESDSHLMTVGSGRPLEGAWKAGQVDMVGWLSELHGLDTLDAYQLLSQISEVPLANVVDTNYSCVTKASKLLLPTSPAFDGLHAELRARSAELGTVNY